MKVLDISTQTVWSPPQKSAANTFKVLFPRLEVQEFALGGK